MLLLQEWDFLLTMALNHGIQHQQNLRFDKYFIIDHKYNIDLEHDHDNQGIYLFLLTIVSKPGKKAMV